MCAVLGAFSTSAVGQLLYDGLQLLQHRGQDAAGIATASGSTFYMHKGRGLVRDVFRTRDMRALQGNMGIGHCRYPTAGSASSIAEAQPFYVNSPFGIMLGHNGNLTNTAQLKREIFKLELRHVNTHSDSEVLLNVLAHALSQHAQDHQLTPAQIFAAVGEVHRRVRGAYSVVAMIAGYGLLAFRDVNGIRPLVLGHQSTPEGTNWLVASESVALSAMGFDIDRDIAPGEAVFIDMQGQLHHQICAEDTRQVPCLFEWVYFARPDSTINNVSVHEARMRMGRYLAQRILSEYAHLDIDVVIPIPDTSRPSAVEIAAILGKPYREGLIKNRYIGRTFIMPGQSERKRSVREKLNAVTTEFAGRNVLLVDDSIVRGTTSREIVQMARDAGARKVYMASAAPPVRFPNVYGIDMPTRQELIASNRSTDEIAREIGVDALIYQELSDLILAVKDGNASLTQMETSCFDGVYITNDIDESYLENIEAANRNQTNVYDSRENSALSMPFS